MPEENPKELEQRLAKLDGSLKIHEDAEQEKKLGQIMLSDSSTESKNAALAEYLFIQGLENASFLAELFLTKGMFTKESRLFQSQMRFDFDTFIKTYCQYLRDDAEWTLKVYGLLHMLDKENKVKMYESIKSGKSLESYISENVDESFLKADIVLVGKALRAHDESLLLQDAIGENVMERLKSKGFGIYVDKKGKVYSIFDEDIESKVAEEKEEIKKHGKSKRVS